MFYSVELLSMRKNGKLSRCWLAGTLSDRLFKKTVSNKVVLKINIQTTCNEILKFINSKTGNKYSRFSLYMSAQLMFGTVKLFRIQTILFHDSLFKIKADLNPIDLAPRKRKRTGDITLCDDTMIEPPPVEFGDLQRKDQHLLLEAQFEMLGEAAFREYMMSPNFGALTDEQMGLILFNDGDIRMCASPDRHGRTIDESREQPRSPGHTTATHNLGLSDALPGPEESANAEITAERISTPRKRPSTATHLDTPTKKLRRELRLEMDAHAKERLEEVAAAFPVDAGIPPPDEFARVPLQDEFADIPPGVEIRPPVTITELPVDETVPQIDESERLPPEAPIFHAPAAEEHNVDKRVPVDSNLHLESLELETPRPRRVRRGRIIRQIDEMTVLPDSMIGKTVFSNPSVHTIKLVRPVPDRERGMLAAALFVNPISNRRCSRAADSSKWAQELLSKFEMRTMGPFIAEIDASMSAEAIRLAESGTQSGLVEISKRHGDTTGLEPSMRNKTAEEPIPVDYDSMTGPLIPEVPGNVPEPSMDIALANITDEPILANISEAQEVDMLPEIEVPPIPHNIPNDPSEAQEVDLPREIEIPPIPQDILDDLSGTRTVTCDTKLLRSDVRESVTTNGKSTSDPNTEDIDAFLPPKLRKKSDVKKETQKKSSSSEVIIDIGESPVSIRSSQNEIHSTWNIPELMAYLEILWHDDPIVKLEVLLPPAETERLDAAVCFNLLLQLSKNGKVILTQTEPYGTINIAKRMTASNMDFDEA